MSVGFHRARSLWLALAVFGGMACSDARQPPQPASFDRPTDVAFVCVRNGELAELGECDFESRDRTLHALVTQSARGEVAAVNLFTERILDNRRDIPGYTFVPTGELPIAIAVSPTNPELTYVASYGSRDVRVMRTRVLVGLSTETAEVQDPIALTIGADGGSFGGTPSDMVLTPDETALIVTLTDVGKVARMPLVQCAEGDSACEPGLVDEDGITFIELPVSTPAAPTALVTDDSYAKLCGDYERPPLPEAPEPAEPPAATAARPIALAIDTSCGGCGDGRVLIADEALPLLHVLDLAALSAGTDPVLAPIPTGAPTRDVVVTPPVPAVFTQSGEVGPDTYFVYAIDAIDGTVMVLENDQLLAVNRDRGSRADRLPLQSRNGSAPPLALALEVITPEFRLGRADDAQYVEVYESASNLVSSRQVCLDDSHTVVTPRRLRGVFLSAAMADGTVRIIDVHDMELRACRTCDGIPGNMFEAPSAPILVRHHPRLVTNPIALEEGDRERDELRPEASAVITVATGRFGLRSNGSVASPLSPSFGCFSCAEGLYQALPDPEDQEANEEDLDPDDEDGGAGDELENICREALVCGLNDPWTAAPSTYVVGYEAALPNTRAADGRFVPPGDADNVSGLLELHSNVSFCGRGVLGRDDVGDARDAATCAPIEVRRANEYTPGSAPLIGDEVVIVSEMLSERALDALDAEAAGGDMRSPEARRKCREVRAKLEEDDTAVLGFEIIAAFEDRIVIRETLSAPFDSGALRLAWTDLQDCVGRNALVTFFVRSQGSFLVQTGNDGFEHNVIGNANGRCVVDAMSGPKASRRTWTGCEYNDGRLQFVLEPFEADVDDVVKEPGNGLGLALQFGVATNSAQLVMNAAQIGFGINSLVPARLRYSATDERLYMVDTYQGGLIPIDLDPFIDTPITSFY